MGEVVTQEPADGSGEGANSAHEPEDPAHVHHGDLSLQAFRKREIVLLPTPGDRVDDGTGDNVEECGEHDSGDQGRDGVGAAQESTRLAHLTRLGYVLLLVNGDCGTHEVFTPPCSRTQLSKSC
ncbi:unannotated protein [freshwater metagenome]|uniref:Unannotated protein n=1 Tax=freshwater metagenome TaxID=449393 RepID=A0A6J7QSC6_9ZZZZ